jgi:hypothetical protein
MNSDSVPTLREIGVRVHHLGWSARRVGSWFIAHAEDCPPRRDREKRRESTRDGVIYDPRTEQVRARFTLNGDLDSAVLGDDARVYSIEGNALVSRREDGADLRTHAQPIYDRGLLAVRARKALVADYSEEGPVGLVLMGLDDEAVIATRALPEPWFVVGDGTLVSYGETRATLVGLDPSTLRPRWTLEVPEEVALDMDARTLSDARRVLLYDDVLWCVDAISGDARVLPWRRREERFWAFTAKGILSSPRPHTLVLRAIETGAVLAEFSSPEPLSHIVVAGERVFVLDEAAVLHVLSLDVGAILAAGRFPRAELFYPTTLSADVEDVFLHGSWPPRALEDESAVTAARAMRGGAGLAGLDRDPRDLIVPESLLNETSSYRPPSNDPARLEAILTVLREEEGSRASAWERLVARGIIPAHFDLAEFPIEDDGSQPRVFQAGARPHEDGVGAWVALAHDAESLVRSRWLARELIERLRPWCAGATLPAVRWRKNGANGWWSSSPRLLQRIFSVIEQVVRVIIPRGDRIVPNLAAAKIAWNYACTEGLRVPQSGPSAWVGRRFDAMPDPFAPWEALTETGHPVLDADDEWITLALVPLTDDFSERVQFVDDDIPF